MISEPDVTAMSYMHLLYKCWSFAPPRLRALHHPYGEKALRLALLAASMEREKRVQKLD